MLRNPMTWIFGTLFLIIAASFFFTAEPAHCKGFCGPDRCTMGVGCLNDCACIMNDGIHGYCAKVGHGRN